MRFSNIDYLTGFATLKRESELLPLFDPELSEKRTFSRLVQVNDSTRIFPCWP